MIKAKIISFSDCTRLLSSSFNGYLPCLVFIDKKGFSGLKNLGIYSTCSGYSSPLFHQKRWFKGDRSSLNGGERKSYGIGGLSRKEEKSLLKKLLDELNLKKTKETIPNIEQSNERFRQIIRDEKLTPEEVQRLQISFAEGYVAAEGKPRSTKKPFKTRLKEYLFFAMVMTLPLLILIEISARPFRRVLIGSGNLVSPEEIDVTFADVRGVEEAKQELQEIVEFLRNPDKFSALGGKLPKGVLLVGPPGTGKTLLARAVAGEAAVPFFHAAGPEFDEILVGQGARRVRDLFATAKLKAPCVVFIDEIDSVGGKRTNSVLHPYANQTINQLLTEMDGFRQNEGVIVLGATNRKEDLDKALLRPGRFDVEVHVPVPDLKDRENIFDLYLSRIKLAPNVDSKRLAKRTIGFTGADIENMVNQAALRAAIDGKSSVSMEYFESARDKVVMGPERKNKIPDEEANKNTAYHEAGHTLVALYTKGADPLHKVTIVPRGLSLGHTALMPDREKYSKTKMEYLADLDVLMGGRVAEEIIFGSEKVTPGASSDFKHATDIATSMVKHFGMSEKVGVRFFENSRDGLVVMNDISNSTSELIDSEIKRILQESYDRAKHILLSKADEHQRLAEALLKYETLDSDEVALVIQGKDPRVLKR
ncbi:ATP-dependent zinc metalloprotease YME1 homolog [Tetranychus urticae]|nr:ATP-dependent zinc metalloprotease YME1 homolog [Tetranychus urticae]